MAFGPGFWLTRRQVDHSIDFADFPTLAVASASQWSCILVTGRAWKVQRLGGEGFLSFSAKKSGVEGLQHNKVGKMCISIHVSVLKIPHQSRWSIYFLEADLFQVFAPSFRQKKKKVRKSTATHSHEGKVPPDGLDLIPQSFPGNLTL